MDSFETPYEDDTPYEFIECTVCEKSIRGTTLYKIHVTTPGHLKKKDGLVASGVEVQEHPVPVFEDILQYLDFLELDEPIIGLNFLEEVPHSLVDLYDGPRYTCKLCSHTANLPDMVHHVIGRRHRMKYVEMKRPDLVTWDKCSSMTYGGKVIRSRAEIVERQDGRGSPLPMKKKGIVGNLNISRGPPRQNANRSQNFQKSFVQRNMPAQAPEIPDYLNESSQRGRFHADLDRQMFPHDEWEGETYGRPSEDPDYCQDYGKQYDPDLPVRGSRQDLPRGLQEHYAQEAPPRRTFTDKDPLKEFYSEEVRGGQVRPEYQLTQLGFSGDHDRRWPLDGDGSRPRSRDRAGWQRLNEPEPTRGSLPTPQGAERTHQPLVRDYGDQRREPHQAEMLPNRGPSRTGPMSDIPEPFRRFLTGAAEEQESGKRKRKSRFSDATADEMETAKSMFFEDFRPPNPKFRGQPRQDCKRFPPEGHGAQRHPDMYTEPQSSHYPGSHQRGGSEAGGVLDILKDIEIENAEEANFLKDKLCHLLREFKAKKSEQAMLKPQGSAFICTDYGNSKPDLQPTPRQAHERTHGDSGVRRQEDVYFDEDHRGRGWERVVLTDERQREHQRPVSVEPRPSNRSRYEAVFGRPETNATHHPDVRAHFDEQFREHTPRGDCRPTAGEVFDLERGPRMNRAQYASKLDKITSTLLELVARKST